MADAFRAEGPDVFVGWIICGSEVMGAAAGTGKGSWGCEMEMAGACG
jgi:hypothetical protein